MHPDTDRHVEQDASTAAIERFGAPARWAAAAPGRVNLIGEHTDYNGGFVLPIAIGRRCVVAARPAADPARSRVLSLAVNAEFRADLRRPVPVSPDGAGGVARGSWASYVVGVVEQFRRLPGVGAIPNVDLVVASDVPLGGGLSSSAAIEVATATVFEQILGVRLAPRQKSALARRAEHEYAGVPCGIMDQFISVMGQQNHALLIDCRTEEARPIPMPPPDRVSVIIANTNVHHELASSEYARRRATCHEAAAALGVAELRDATMDQIDAGGLTEEQARCAGHVVGENRRTLAAAEALAGGDMAAMGGLMYESHASLRDLYRISCPELDSLVELAQPIPGVFGARMTGGGFGGCVVILAEPACTKDLARALSEGYSHRHDRDCTVFSTTASEGAAALDIRC